MCIREACRVNGIPRSTVQDRFHGRILEKGRNIGPNLVLGIDGEENISQWMIKLAKCGFSIRKKKKITRDCCRYSKRQWKTDSI